MSHRDFLKEIISKKKERIIQARQLANEEELKGKVKTLGPTRPFIEAINKPRVISLIAEIKKASPSRGLIRENFDHRQAAQAYQEAGVQAVSVLTEEDYFLGNISYINDVKGIASAPVLRKDFIIEPYQLYESRFFGADAVLLIADLLAKDKLSELLEISAALGMDALVEAHSEKELKKTISLKNAPLIGINNRNLRTLEVDLKTTERLFTMIPSDKVVVVESGIKTYQDVLFLKVLGVHAVLIGEAFMAVENIRQKVEEVMGW